MAKTSTELPRDIQSELHDIADKAGERVAMGQMVEIEYLTPAVKDALQRCVCVRFSKIETDGRVAFTNWQDPNCQYQHLTPLVEAYSIMPA